MSDEIKKYLKELKGEISKENLKFKEEIIRENLKLKEEFSEETRRHMSVLSEDYQHKLNVVVEGHQVLDKKIDDLKEGSRKEHEETRSLLKLLHLELDKKVRTVENEYTKLKTRVERLETARP